MTDAVPCRLDSVGLRTANSYGFGIKDERRRDLGAQVIRDRVKATPTPGETWRRKYVPGVYWTATWFATTGGRPTRKGKPADMHFFADRDAREAAIAAYLRSAEARHKRRLDLG
jgi:hypothetical protein